MVSAVLRRVVARNDASQTAVQGFVKQWIVIIAGATAMYFVFLAVLALAVR